MGELGKLCVDFYKNRQWKPQRKREHGGGKSYRPEPDEEQEGMPQHQHCPPAKRRDERSPTYRENQQKDVA
jgi:hypothetical protein